MVNNDDAERASNNSLVTIIWNEENLSRYFKKRRKSFLLRRVGYNPVVL